MKVNRIIILGIIIFLVISSNSLLHVNEAEFLRGRFGSLSPFQMSLFDTTLYVAYLVFGLLIGVLSSGTGRRRIFVLSGSTGAAAMLVLMPMAKAYPLLLVLRFFQGAFCVLAWQTAMTLILDYSGDEDRGRNMGIFGIFMALAMGVGPMAGGFVAGMSMAAPYYAAAIENVLSCILTVIFLSDAPVSSGRSSLRESVGIIRGVPALLIPAMINFVDRLHMGFTVFILPLFITDVLGMAPHIRGMVMGLYSLPFILLQYPVGKWSDRWGRLRLLIPGSLGYALVLSVSGFIGREGLIPLALCFIVLGIFSGLTGPPNNALVGDLVRPAHNAMAMAVFNLAGNIGIVAGPLIGGAAMGSVGFAWTFTIAGLIEGMSLIVVVVFRHYLSGSKRTAAACV